MYLLTDPNSWNLSTLVESSETQKERSSTGRKAETKEKTREKRPEVTPRFMSLPMAGPHESLYREETSPADPYLKGMSHYYYESGIIQ